MLFFFPERFRSPLLLTFQFSSFQNGILALGKAYMRFIPSVRSLKSPTLPLVQISVGPGRMYEQRISPLIAFTLYPPFKREKIAIYEAYLGLSGRPKRG